MQILLKKKKKKKKITFRILCDIIADYNVQATDFVDHDIYRKPGPEFWIMDTIKHNMSYKNK